MRLDEPRGFAALKRRFIGNKAFFAALVTLVLPLAVQQGLSSMISLVDNVMVGGLSTESISGVAIVNQLIFVFQLTVFGALSGASIFGAQYAGVHDDEAIRYTFRYKLMVGFAITLLAMGALAFFGDELIALYIHTTADSAASPILTAREGRRFLNIALAGLPPFVVSQCLASTFRELKETRAPMRASIASILVTLSLNYVLIYGKLGLPRLGVQGSALATAIARYVEAVSLILYALRSRDKHPFIRGALKSLRIPVSLVKRITVMGLPLLVNEFFWSAGMALINRNYSVRGLDIVAATNIATTVWQFFAVIMYAMGTAISMLAGQKLGAGDIAGARDENRKLIFADVVFHVVIGLFIIALSEVIPLAYNVGPEVRALTSRLLRIAGTLLGLFAFTHAAYFTIRSGGRTLITFLFDSAFTLLLPVPVSYILCKLTSLDFVWVYACVQLCDVAKAIAAVSLLLKGSWAQKVISN